MAVTAERLRIEVEADTDAATRGLKDLEGTGSRIPGWAKAAGAALAGAFAVDKIVGGIRAAVTAASDLEQSVGGVGAVFGENRGQIDAWAAGAAKALGLSQNSYNEFATVVGSQLRNMGVPMDEVNGKTNDLITMGADLAATFGGPTSEAVSALSALMRGEADPIERYGVSIKDADIQARLAAMGLKGLEGEAGKAARTQAILALLTEQTAAAQGSFARESATFAGTQQRLTASWENLTAIIGGAFLPAGTQVLNWAQQAVDWLSARLPGAIEQSRAALANLTSGMAGGGFMAGLVAEVQGGLTAMRAAFAEGGNDITSSGLAGAMEAIGLAARNFLDPVLEAFRSIAPAVAPVIPQVLQAAQAFSPLGLILQAVTPLLPVIGSALGQVAATLVGALGPALAAIVPALAQVATALGGALTSALAAILPAILGLLPSITSLATTLVGALLPVLTALLPVVSQVGAVLIGALAQAFVAILPAVTGLLPVITQVASVLGSVLLTAVTALSPLLTLLADVFAQVVTAVAPVVGVVGTLIGALAPVVTIVGDLISALLPPLVDLFMALLGPVLALIAPLVGELAPILTTVGNIISSVVVPALGTLASWLGTALGAVLPVASAIAGGLVSALSSLIRWLVNAASGVAQFVGDAVAKFGQFVSTVGSAIGDAIGFVTDLPGKITGVFAGAGTWLLESGKKIIQGLVDGIKGMVGKVTDAVGGVLSKARDLLPFSPAKTGPFSGRGWTLYSGRSISGALAQGIRDETDQVVAASRALVDAAALNLPGASIGAPSLGSPGSGAHSGPDAPSPADALGVGSASGYAGPSTLVFVDADGNLIGRMRAEAGKVASGKVTPLDEGLPTW